MPEAVPEAVDVEAVGIEIADAHASAARADAGSADVELALNVKWVLDLLKTA